VKQFREKITSILAAASSLFDHTVENCIHSCDCLMSTSILMSRLGLRQAQRIGHDTREMTKQVGQRLA
jgi:hypothetical protein